MEGGGRCGDDKLMARRVKCARPRQAPNLEAGLMGFDYLILRGSGWGPRQGSGSSPLLLRLPHGGRKYEADV